MTTCTPRPADGVEIDRQRRDQRLAFAGLHLGDLAFVQDHAADQLHVEMALAERALGRLAHGGEGRHQDVVERLAFGDLRLEGVGARAQLVVRQLCEFRLQRVDGVDPGLIAPDAPFVRGAEQLAGETTDHRISFQASRRGWAASGLTIQPLTRFGYAAAA